MIAKRGAFVKLLALSFFVFVFVFNSFLFCTFAHLVLFAMQVDKGFAETKLEAAKPALEEAEAALQVREDVNTIQTKYDTCTSKI
jgi:hypothetical protein